MILAESVWKSQDVIAFVYQHKMVLLSQIIGLVVAGIVLFFIVFIVKRKVKREVRIYEKIQNPNDEGWPKGRGDDDRVTREGEGTSKTKVERDTKRRVRFSDKLFGKRRCKDTNKQSSGKTVIQHSVTTPTPEPPSW